MRALFEDELKKLHVRFSEMGINVSEQIYRATKAFVDHDKQLAQEVIDYDNETNDDEMGLEKQALELIALQQPVATDFRVIISILKASSDLERVGDHAVGIARETIREKGSQRVPEIENQISKMSDEIREMLSGVLDAYAANDDAKATAVAKKDIEVDKHYIEIRDAITKAVAGDSTTAAATSSYLLVIKLLERIGDHLVNISEWIVYSSAGKIVELNPGKSDPELLSRIMGGK
ncbi:phosphate transport system regulatory protein PhoU [Lentilactobacillus curieae]|uniref:Phosphate-specific transport system accessory protein PhoU n=1 Tax=Lentilactobacillus curieae TaxID=1138822 RepID=A0A1S6QHU2_9LACO|nr:phosphate signaling complex protein PhoU [Lentilactobacillus curieae]AQW21186.1 phosphate transport system regulatory protein PhoU [Lentilactobacillus curieae]